MNRLSITLTTAAVVVSWLIGVCIGQWMGHNLFTGSPAHTLSTILGGCCVVSGLAIAAMAGLHMLLYGRIVR